MDTHVTLKVVGPPDPRYQQVIRVHSGPSVRCAAVEWECGICWSYASRVNTYRTIAKDCTQHACLIPEPSAPAPPPPVKARKPRKAKPNPVRQAPPAAPAPDVSARDLARMCEQSVRYPTHVAALKSAKQARVYHCPRCGGFHLTTQKQGSK